MAPTRRHGRAHRPCVLLLLVAWKLGADIAGPLYAADPFKVLQRIVSDTLSGSLLRHIYVTLRLSALALPSVARSASPCRSCCAACRG